jgi:hypothetical protein
LGRISVSWLVHEAEYSWNLLPLVTFENLKTTLRR